MKIVDFINIYNPNIINPYIILLPNFVRALSFSPEGENDIANKKLVYSDNSIKS